MPVLEEQLADRLRARRPEIEEVFLATTGTIPSGTFAAEDPEYAMSLHMTIREGVGFGIAVIESPVGEIPPIPSEMLIHTRLAARHRIGLDAVIRGYVLASARMVDFILDECDLRNAQPLLRAQAAALDNLLHQISLEYKSERHAQTKSRETRRLEQITSLLRGERHSGDLDYNLSVNHVGLVARGDGVKQALVDLSKAVDCRLLLVMADPETAWAWLGRKGPIQADDVRDASSRSHHQLFIGLGEAAPGIVGWRLTHNQAKAALPIALNNATRLARYLDVCLHTSARQDNLLRTTLTETYIRPLLVGKDGGAAHLQTLHAYFANDRNGRATSDALGISRQAVSARLRTIEGRLGTPLSSCATPLALALKLADTVQPADVRSL